MREIKAGDLTIRGTSTAGIRTSLHVPQLKVVLDAGIAHPSFAKEKNIFLSHCHMDHVGALLSLLGNRDLKRLEAPTVWVPMGVHEEVSALVQLGNRMGKFADKARVVALSNFSLDLGSGVEVTAFDTHHAVPSNGYVFRTSKKRLKPEYRDLGGPEIASLVQQGVEVNEWVDQIRLAYLTDTTAEVWDSYNSNWNYTPPIFEADVLVMECTFLDDDKPVSEARKHGHIHLDEIAAAADRFKNKHIVLMHFSARYDNDEIQRRVDEKLPADLRERVQLLLPEDE